jgi:tRNA modification GTPase
MGRMSGPDPGNAAEVRCRLLPATAMRPGAIAILQLAGDVEPVLAALTGVADWPIGRARLVRFDDIDEGLAVRLREDLAQCMPHGGPRVGQRLIRWMIEQGVELAAPSDLPPEVVYPDAADRHEALALAAVARAASPLAIDLLLDQPRRWRAGIRLSKQDEARSRRLDRLIDPPVVVVAGGANVGKSTLSNALIGRSMSIAADLPGTTRDYTSGRIELSGLVVDFHDTPGLRSTTDPIEIKAVQLARRLLEGADLVIAMTDTEHDWPSLPRQPDLRVVNKVDLATGAACTGEPAPPGTEPEQGRVVAGEPLRISALTGEGLSDLVQSVRDRLVPPADLEHPGPWLFDRRLLKEEGKRQ